MYICIYRCSTFLVKHSIKLVYSIKLYYIVHIDLKTVHFSIAYYEYGVEFATIISDFIQINTCALKYYVVFNILVISGYFNTDYVL